MTNLTLEQIQEAQKIKVRKERRTSDVILMVLFICTIAIIVAYFYCILVVGIEPTVIVQEWFRVLLGELGILGLIKVAKEWRRQ